MGSLPAEYVIHEGEGENVQKQWSLFPAELVRRKLHSIGSRWPETGNCTPHLIRFPGSHPARGI